MKVTEIIVLLEIIGVKLSIKVKSNFFRYGDFKLAKWFKIAIETGTSEKYVTNGSIFIIISTQIWFDLEISENG